MADPDGLVILDANCYHHLTDAKCRDVLLPRLAEAGWFIWPSAVNAFELAKHPTPRKRRELLSAVYQVQQGRPLLPLPDEVLQLAGDALLDGHDLKIAESGYEWLTEDPDALTDAQLAAMVQAMAAVDARHHAAIDFGRRDIHKLYKEKAIKPWWNAAAAFLDEVWMTPSQLNDLIANDCARFGMRGTLCFQDVMDCEAWRLHFEAFGVALFRRAVGKHQEKVVQYWDLSQLVYLGGRAKRALVSDDGEFRQAAIAVLENRHPASHVMTWEDFMQPQLGEA